MAPNECLITGEKVAGWIDSGQTIKYELIFNGQNYTLEYDKTSNWERILDKDNKLVLKAWLWNKQWPIAAETILTEPLIDRALRQIDHPANDFYKKLDYLLLNYYQNGGRELKPLLIGPKRKLLACTDSIEEFDRIIEAGKQKKWIEYHEKKAFRKTSYYIRLTGEGLQHCDELEKRSGGDLLKKDFRPLQGKSILMVYVEEDREWGRLIGDKLMNRGANVVQHSNGITDDDTSYVYNSARSLKDTDFVVLIKSAAADAIRIWGDMLAAVGEEERRTPDKNPFFHVLVADDSQVDKYSYLFHKNSMMWDIRLIPHQEKFFLYVASALAERTKRNNSPSSTDNAAEQIVEQKLKPELFNWPKPKLTKAQRHWLGFLYTKFLKGEDVDFQKEEPLHWEKFGKEEKPTQLNSLLISGSDLTLLGIWTIDNKSKLFQLFEDTILEIRRLFSTRGGFDQIDSDELKRLFPNASMAELKCIGKLLHSHGFSNGSGTREGGGFYNRIDNNRRDKIRLYPGVEKLVLDEINKDGNLEVEDSESTDEEHDHDYGDMPEMFKNATKIELSDRPSKIVLGVDGLANDIVEIIHRIPPQIGRMIGIFGPWGRGKTVLIEKISSLLENSDKNWKKVTNWEKLCQRLRLQKPIDYSSETTYELTTFHAWKFQDSPGSWAYLYECFADTYYRKPKSFWRWIGWTKYFWRIFKLNAYRTKLIPLLKTIGIGAIAGLLLWIVVKYEFDKYKELALQLKAVGATAIVTATIFLLDRVLRTYRNKASDLIKRFTTRTSFKNEMGLQAEIQKELQLLLRAWSGNKTKRYPSKKLVLIVEDIDRCSEDKIMSTIDGLRVILENPEVAQSVIIICAVDERVLSRAIFSKYKTLMKKEPDTPLPIINNIYPDRYSFADYSHNSGSSEKEPDLPTEMQILTSEYFDKLFILAIKLGNLNAKERVELIDAFMDSEINETSSKNSDSNNSIDQQENEKETQNERESVDHGEIEIEGHRYDFETYQPLDGREPINFQPTDQQPVNEPKISADIEFESFTADERGLVRSIVENWEGATPRQIRIFYYRYMLAKNMLIQRYTAQSKENIWKTYPFAEYLPFSIAHYMSYHQANLIYEKKISLLESDPDEKVNLPDNYSTAIAVVDYIELLSVLETVVAY